MALTLVTGMPGAGKTLYAVSRLIKVYLSEKLSHTVDGEVKEVARRMCVDGIPDLLIEHETMSRSRENERGELVCDGQGLANWYEWAQPGDVIVVDEVQRYWRPRGMGTKPPPSVRELETHRHKGVDMVFITQHPMLLDQNVRRLINRHIHVRRLWGMKRAAIYEWDSCSSDPNRVGSAQVSYWAYSAKDYASYKSSQLHTRPKMAKPVWLALPVLALAGGVAVAPKAYEVFKGAMTGRGLSSSSESVSDAPVKPPNPGPPMEPASGDSVIVRPVMHIGSPEPVMGRMCINGRCTCYGQARRLLAMSYEACATASLVPWEPLQAPVPVPGAGEVVKVPPVPVPRLT